MAILLALLTAVLDLTVRLLLCHYYWSFSVSNRAVRTGTGSTHVAHWCYNYWDMVIIKWYLYMLFRITWLTAFCVLAAQRLAPATGGMVTSTLVQLWSCRPTGHTVTVWLILLLWGIEEQFFGVRLSGLQWTRHMPEFPESEVMVNSTHTNS